MLEDRDFLHETKAITQGKLKMDRVSQRFSQWALSELSVKILNIKLAKLEQKMNKYEYVLYVIVESTDDYNKLASPPFSQEKNRFEKKIIRKFQTLTLLHNTFTFLHIFNNIYVSYFDFSKEAKYETISKASQEISKQIKSQFPGVWDVKPLFWGVGLVVFYFLDDDIILNEYRGVSKQIADECFLLIKKYDDLGLFREDNINLSFDSKAGLARSRGSMYYYEQRNSS